MGRVPGQGGAPARPGTGPSETGLRWPRCGLLDEGRHARWCPDFAHEIQLVIHDSRGWLLSSGTYVPPEPKYSVRCSCGHETGRYSRKEWAVDAFRDSHGADMPLQVVPEVHA